MRLNTFLNEKQYRYSRPAEEQRKSARWIIKKRYDEVKKWLKWHDFNVNLTKLCMILSSIFMKDRIRFIGDGPEYIPNFKYIKGADFYKNGDIEIFLTKEVPEHLKQLYEENRFKDLNDKFYKELIWTLAHTKVHVQRIKRLKDMFNFVGYQPIKKHIIENQNHYAYISATEKEEDGFSTTRSLVHDLIGTLPEYKDFLELMRQYENGELPKPPSVGLLD